MKLRQVVITSVTRDDLPDGGASIFARTIELLRRQDLKLRIEVLAPDFKGDKNAIGAVLEAAPPVRSSYKVFNQSQDILESSTN